MTANPAYAAEMADEDLDVAISLRITKEDKAALDALAAKYPLKALTIARIAVRLGIAEIRGNPGALFMGPQLKTAEEQELEADAGQVDAEIRAGKKVGTARYRRAILTHLNKKKGR